MNKAYIFAFLVISLALGFTLYAFSASMTPYVDIHTARQSTSPVQVKGNILHDTVTYDKAIGALRFQIEDKNKERIEVVYLGAKPDAFDTAPETAATGMIQKDKTDGHDIFVSRSMVVKCPSKYDDQNKGKKSQTPTVASAGQGA